MGKGFRYYNSKNLSIFSRSVVEGSPSGVRVACLLGATQEDMDSVITVVSLHLNVRLCRFPVQSAEIASCANSLQSNIFSHFLLKGMPEAHRYGGS